MAVQDADRSFLMSLLMNGVLKVFGLDEIRPEAYPEQGRVLLFSPWTGRRFELTLKAIDPDPRPWPIDPDPRPWLKERG